MKANAHLVVALSLFTLFTSCASGYRAISPDKIYYNAKAIDNGLEMGYKYDVLNERGNKKYAKKESKKGIKVVAVKLTNNTQRALQFGENAKIFSADREIVPLDPNVVVSSLKQKVPLYLLYLLLTPMNLYTSNTNGTVNSIPIGLVVGPVISGGNMMVSGSANKRFRKELMEQSLFNKIIQPGETVYGLIGISDRGYNPLTVKIINQ